MIKSFNDIKQQKIAKNRDFSNVSVASKSVSKKTVLCIFFAAVLTQMVKRLLPIRSQPANVIFFIYEKIVSLAAAA